MFCAENFEDIFDLDQNDFYNDNIIISICDNRKTLQMLFIDRIMKILGIKKREQNEHLRGEVTY